MRLNALEEHVEIKANTKVAYPRDVVWVAMRDQMPRLAEFLPNIDTITVESREDTETGTILVNRWQAAKSEIPMVARKFVKPEQMYWLDFATWTDDKWQCAWRLEMGFMKERVQCSGTTTYVEVEGGTEMQISGDLQVQLKGLIPRLLIGKAKPAIEGFVTRMLRPNFQKTADALGDYLDAQAKNEGT